MLLLLSIGIGVFVGVLVFSTWLVVDAVPDEDRSFLDRPPTVFRWVWPMIKVLEHYFGFLVTDNYVLATTLRLKRAGVEYSLSPAQFMAGKCLSAVVSATIMLMLMATFQSSAVVMVLLAAVAGFFYPELWLKETMDRRAREVFRALPFYLDVITLAIEAGTNLTGGITQAVHKGGEGALRVEFSRVLRDIRAGKTRADALREMAARTATPAVNAVVSSMVQAERAGSSLGPVLRAQSEQLRNTRFLNAEKLAMEAPVKLLAPLVMFIFPTTFIVIGFVILSKAILSGIIDWAPLVWAASWPISP